MAGEQAMGMEGGKGGVRDFFVAASIVTRNQKLQELGRQDYESGNNK